MSEQEIKENANVLYICDYEDEYNAFLKSGFKNVDYFKSFYVAEKYFEENSEELNKYHIILISHQFIGIYLYSHKNNDLSAKIYKIAKSKTAVVGLITVYSDTNCNVQIVGDYSLGTNIPEKNYYMLSEKIAKYVKLRHVVEEFPKEFIPIKEYGVSTILDHPKSFDDIKVLYLNHSDIDESYESYFSKIADYDIILANKKFSSKILDWETECLEQSKYTGRDFIVLITFEIKKATLIFNYIYAGINAPDKEFHIKEIHLPDAINLTDFIIKNASSIYSDALKLIDGTNLEDKRKMLAYKQNIKTL